MEKHVHACPNCQSRFQIPESATGRKVNCPKCEQHFVVANETRASSKRPIRVPKSQPKGPTAIQERVLGILPAGWDSHVLIITNLRIIALQYKGNLIKMKEMPATIAQLEGLSSDTIAGYKDAIIFWRSLQHTPPESKWGDVNLQLISADQVVFSFRVFAPDGRGRILLVGALPEDGSERQILRAFWQSHGTGSGQSFHFSPPNEALPDEAGAVTDFQPGLITRCARCGIHANEERIHVKLVSIRSRFYTLWMTMAFYISLAIGAILLLGAIAISAAVNSNGIAALMLCLGCIALPIALVGGMAVANLLLIRGLPHAPLSLAFCNPCLKTEAMWRGIMLGSVAGTGGLAGIYFIPREIAEFVWDKTARFRRLTKIDPHNDRYERVEIRFPKPRPVA